jgi:tetratricopeptide (TPR) repeat protein
MVQRYYLKKNDGEKGPYLESEIGQLYIDGVIGSSQLIRGYQDKDFRPLDEFSELMRIIDQVIKGELTRSDLENSTRVLINSLQEQRAKIKEEKKKREVEEILERMEVSKEKEEKEFSFEIKTEIPEKPKKKKKVEDKKIKKEKIEEEDEDKTKINLEFQKKYAPVKNDEDERVGVEDEDDYEPTMATKIDQSKQLKEVKSSDDTVVGNLYEIIPKVSQEVLVTEEKLKENEKEKEKIKTVGGNKKEKKGLRPIVAFSFIVVLYFLIFDEEPHKTEPRYATIKFPQIQDKANPDKAKDYLKQAVEEYEKGTFQSLVKASSYLSKSVGWKIKRNSAFEFLILVNSELLPHTERTDKSKIEFFKLLKLKKSKLYSNSNVAMGAANFYLHIDKPTTAKMILEKYLRVSKPSKKLISLYLKTLILSGDFVQAKSAYEKLSKMQFIPLEAYLAMAQYQVSENRYDKSEEILKKAFQEFPKSIEIILSYADTLVKANKFTKIPIILKYIEASNAEGSAYYYSKYLETMGMYLIYKKKYEAAAKSFKAALAINKESELTSILSNLSLGGEGAVRDVIRKGKLLDLIKKARSEYNNGLYDQALFTATKAVDLDESYIPSKVLLAKVHTKQGYFSRAIEILEDLYKSNVKNTKVVYEYLNTLVEAYKLKQLKKKLVALSNTEFRQTSEYSRVEGKYFYRRGNYLKAIKSFQLASISDPFDDQIHFELANVYMELRKYRNALETINKAIEIDPVNLTYHILYSKVLYEKDGLDVSLGYLRDLQKEYPDDYRIKSNIAILYYRAGKVSEFNELKEKIESSLKVDKDYYRFMVRNAILEDDTEGVIKYSKLLLKVEPSNLENRMRLAVFLLEDQRYKDSITVLKQIEERLKSYPKLNYYFSKAHFYRKEIDKAIEYAELEVQYNPLDEWGYTMLGEIYTKTGKYLEAQKQLELALKKNIKSVDALMAMAWIKFQQNYINEALELYKRALVANPNNPIAHRQLGKIYQKKGQRVLAYESYRVYLDLLPDAKDKSQVLDIMKSLKE